MRGRRFFVLCYRGRGEVIVSDAFRDRVLEAKLKGFEFKEVWDSEVTEEMERERQRKYEEMLASIERNKGKEYFLGRSVCDRENRKGDGKRKMEAPNG